MSSSVSLEYLNQQIAGLTITSPTSTHMSAQNTAGSTIVVILGGAAVPLPTQTRLNGFTANGANTQFTVGTTGNYYIEYQVNTTASLLLQSGLYVNGVATPSLTRNPGVAGSTFSAASIIPLAVGNTLQLTLFGLAGTAILQGGVGAYLNVVRLS